MVNDQSIEDAIETYHLGLHGLGSMLSSIFGLLVNGDIDALLSDLPPETNDWLMWELRDAYAPTRENEPQNYIILEGASIIPGREEEYHADRSRREERLRSVEIPKLQSWLRKHPLPPREAFPLDLVRDLHSRIDSNFKAILSARPPNLTLKQLRAWPDRQRVEELGSIGTELMKAVRRAELDGTGSQEQSLAWEGFDRVAGILARREDLSGAERTLLDAARARREYHIRSIGHASPGTRGVYPK